MQVLPREMQELLPMALPSLPPIGKALPKGKTASEQFIDQQELRPMRLAQVGLGSGVGASGILASVQSWREVRVLFVPFPATPNGYRNRDPGDGHYESILQKRPPAATDQEVMCPYLASYSRGQIRKLLRQFDE